MICCCCGPEPKSVVEMSVKDTHINKYQEVCLKMIGLLKIFVYLYVYSLRNVILPVRLVLILLIVP